MDEGPILPTDVRFALIFYAPTQRICQRILKEHTVFVLFVFFFFFFFFFSKWLEPLFWVKI